jgi:cytochrome c6
MKVRTLVVAALLAIPIAAVADDDIATLYKSKCSGCHGTAGAGDSAVGKKLGVKPLNSAEVQKKSDKDLQKIITDGQGKMPAFKGKIGEEQIEKLVGFIRGLSKK